MREDSTSTYTSSSLLHRVPVLLGPLRPAPPYLACPGPLPPPGALSTAAARHAPYQQNGKHLSLIPATTRRPAGTCGANAIVTAATAAAAAREPGAAAG